MTSLLGSSRIQDMAREESVRGVMVRMALKRAEHAGDEELMLLEKSVALLLSRFQAMEDARS